MVSPHFPPDTSAGTHRVRLLAPHLPLYGWTATVVTVDPSDYEGRLDPGLADLVSPSLEVVRCRAWPAPLTRRLGLGDLGLRALQGLYRACAKLLAEERFDALFITIYPSYPAVLGPSLKRRFGIPFVLDYQDPWVGAWGDAVGGGPEGRPDLKSRITRRLAEFLEPRVLRYVDAATAVSFGTLAAIAKRSPRLRDVPTDEIPIGGENADFEHLRAEPRHNRHFDPADGYFHLCYVGTLLPLGFETLRAVLRAAAKLRAERPTLAERLRLHFYGTSNQTASDAPLRVAPEARRLGIADLVTEIAPRLDYLDALTVQTQASALLLMGGSERHYTASKLYPCLLARRPLLAVYHEASTVVEILRRTARPPTARLVTYSDERRAEDQVDLLAQELSSLLGRPLFQSTDVNETALDQFSARALAGRLAQTLDQAIIHFSKRGPRR